VPFGAGTGAARGGATLDGTTAPLCTSAIGHLQL
jgi:hypothetical protein